MPRSFLKSRVIALGLVVFSTAIFQLPCGSDAAIAEETPTLSKLEIIAWLQARRFEDLEDYMMGESWEPENGCCLRQLWAFRHSDPANEDALNEWVEKRPHSIAAVLARATYNQHLALLNRGGAFANRTDLRRFLRMLQHLKLAIADLKAVLAIERRLEQGFEALIEAVRVGGHRKQLDAVYRWAMAVLPDSARIHKTYLFALQEKWLGSPGEHAAYENTLKKRYAGVAGFEFLAPRDPEIDAAWEAKSRGDLKAALRLFTEAIRSRPTAGRFKARARVYYQMKDYEKAVADLDEAAHLAPDSRSLHIRRMRYLEKARKYAAAREAIDRAVGLDPYNPTTLMKKFDFLKRAVLRSIREKDVRAYIEAKNEQERTLEAATVYGEDWQKLHRNGGFYWLGRGHLDRAVREFEAAISLPPVNPENWRGYSTALFYAGNCEAVQAGETYVKLCTSDSDCPLNMTFINHIRQNLAPRCEQSDPGPPPLMEKPLNLPGSPGCAEFFKTMERLRALEACLNRADVGDPKAQRDMALFHLQGQMGFQSFERAVEWLRRASDQGDADAQALLGEKYVFGIGVAQDKEEGLRLLDLAIRQNSPEGYLRLGSILYAGRLLPEDKERGRALIAKAAELGHPRAKQVLDRMPDG